MSVYFDQFLNANYTTAVMAEQEQILGDKLNNYLYTPDISGITPYDILIKFLSFPLQDQYQQNINILQNFVNISQKNDPNKKNVYRIVATIADGTVWFDSSKTIKNTWVNYQAKAINENHNSKDFY